MNEVNDVDVTGDTGTHGGQEVGFMDSLPEDLRGNEALSSFTDAGSLAKAHIELLGKIPKVPDSYDFGETALTGKGFTEKFIEAAKEKGLSQDQASGIYEMFAGIEQAAMDKQSATLESWKAETKKMWPGSSLKENLESARAAFMRFGGKELASLMVKTGMGENPTILKAFAAINKSISEDGFLSGGDSAPVKLARTDGGTPMLDFPSMDKK